MSYGPEELLPSPMWQDDYPAAATGFAYVTDGAYLREGQERVLLASATGTQDVGGAIPVVAGEQYFITVEHQGSAGLTYGLKILNSGETETDYIEVVLDAQDDWVVAHLTVVIPAGGAYAIPQLRCTGASSVYVAYVSVRKVTGATTDQGWIDTLIQDTVVSSLQVRDPLQDVSAISMDDTGVISAKTVNATDALTYQGQEMSALLNAKPYGTLTKTLLGTSITALTTTARAVISSNFVLPGTGDRQIRLTIGLRVTSGATYPVAMDIKFNSSSTATTGNSTHTTLDGEAGVNAKWLTYVYEFNTSELGVDPAGTRFLSALVCARTSSAGQTAGTVNVTSGNGTYLLVEDMGEAIPTGQQTTGGGGEAVGLITRTSPATSRKWDQTYKGDGTKYTYDDTKLYQGYYLSSNGVLKSAIGAPDQMFTDLAGATVNWIKLYLYADHWREAAGGIAVLALHGASTMPTTLPAYSSSHIVPASGRWSRDKGIAITLPYAWYAGFKSGANRGVVLTANGSTASTYYGYFTASPTWWQWNYTK